MYRFEVSQFVVVRIYTDAEEQSSIASIDQFVVSKLYPPNQGKTEHNTTKNERRMSGTDSLVKAVQRRGADSPRQNWIGISDLSEQ